MRYDVSYYYENGRQDLLNRRTYKDNTQAVSTEITKMNEDNAKLPEGKKCIGFVLYKLNTRTGCWKTILEYGKVC